MIKKTISKLSKNSCGSDVKSAAPQSKNWGFSNMTSEQLRSLIAKKAYGFYQSRGWSHGNDLADWFQAEKTVLADLKKQR